MSDEARPTMAEWAKRRPARRFRLGMEPVGRYILAEQERDEAEARLAEALAGLADLLQFVDRIVQHESRRGRTPTPDTQEILDRARAILAGGQPARQGEPTP